MRRLPFDEFMGKHRWVRAQRTGSRDPIQANEMARFVLEKAPFSSTDQLAHEFGVNPKQLSWAVNRVYGKGLSELQKEARLAFIEQHQSLSNKDLSKKFSISLDTTRRLLSLLRAQGRISSEHRQKGRNYLDHDALPLQRQPLAYEILSTMGWVKSGAMFNTQELILATGKFRQSVLLTMNRLKKYGLVKVNTQKRPFSFQITPQGYAWLRRMSQVIEAREEKAKKGISGLLRLLRKKQFEKERLLKLQLFLMQQGDSAKAETLSALFLRLRNEETQIKSMLAQMQNRKEKTQDRI